MILIISTSAFQDPVRAASLSGLLLVFTFGSPVYHVTAHHSQSHPHHCCPHLEARHFLTSLKHVSSISVNPRGV
ncbi:hypothetical protein EDB83DRAFT_2420553 [Lactarius deliciosus]|nr:hypothetical protein EDB83DRAFT_2420553 [Lactarius deliciosus]